MNNNTRVYLTTLKILFFTTAIFLFSGCNKYYELQLVKENEHVTRATKEPTREEMKKQRTSARRFILEGLDKNMILY